MRPRCRSCHQAKATEYQRNYSRKRRLLGVGKEARGEVGAQLDTEQTIRPAPPVTALELRVKAEAACKDFPGFLDQIPRGGNAYSNEARHWGPRRAVCNACPVKVECREWGDWFEPEWFQPGDLSRPERLGGMLGGETPRERIERRQKERHEAA